MLLKTNNQVYHLMRAARPRQWIKNLSLYAAVTFGDKLFERKEFTKATFAFVIFCMLSSGTYLINDLHDSEKDKLHPIKRHRPIPSGELSRPLAKTAAVILVALALILSLKLNFYFFLLCLTYLSLQILYTYKIRNVIILDALVVALGFIFRVIAGGLSASVSISSWLILATIGLSLLLAFGKRRSERTILSSRGLSLDTRKTLAHYPDSLLDSMISVSASFAIITYSLFTFQVSPFHSSNLFKEYLPATLSNPKWMMLTIPLVIYGVARYLYVIYERKDAESPERVLINDKPLFVVTTIWALSTVFMLYVIS